MFQFRLPAILFVLCFPALTMAAGPDLRTFKSKVEPILAQYCYQCHGPQGEAAPPFRVQRNRVAEVEDDYGSNPTHEPTETRRRCDGH
jgi:hypothetical protein